jgi:hypothetical protein
VALIKVRVQVLLPLWCFKKIEIGHLKAPVDVFFRGTHLFAELIKILALFDNFQPLLLVLDCSVFGFSKHGVFLSQLFIRTKAI